MKAKFKINLLIQSADLNAANFYFSNSKVVNFKKLYSN